MPEVNNSSLSYGDALFLYLEREGTPLNVASVVVFEGLISLDACIDFVESKLPLIPRYWQRVEAPPFNLGLPSWQFDPAFDIRKHVREVTLKRGTELELKKLAAGILSVNMDRSRPLWDLTLVHGLKGNRTGMVIRVHHCLADGVSGVGLLNALLDPSPDSPKLPKTKPHFEASARPHVTSLLEGVLNTFSAAVESVLQAESELLKMAQQVVTTASAARDPNAKEANGENPQSQMPSLDELRGLMPELAAPVQRLPFNVVCRGPQTFNWGTVPLPEIKTMKQAVDATVNDVVLALVTSVMRGYAQLHGLNLAGRSLRIIVPVNVRGNGNVQELGNRLTFVPVSIPMDIPDPVELVTAVHERTDFIKHVRLGELIGLAGTLLGTIPTSLQALLGPIASMLPLSVCNLICTNVPGPRVPLYLMGHKLLAAYPYVPIGGEMGMNCAILTYDGTAHFGFTCDAFALPDGEVLDGLLAASLAEFRKAFGIRSTTRKRAPARRATPAAKRVRKAKPKPHDEATGEAAEAQAVVPFAATVETPAAAAVAESVATVSEPEAAVAEPEAAVAEAAAAEPYMAEVASAPVISESENVQESVKASAVGA